MVVEVGMKNIAPQGKTTTPRQRDWLGQKRKVVVDVQMPLLVLVPSFPPQPMESIRTMNDVAASEEEFKENERKANHNHNKFDQFPTSPAQSPRSTARPRRTRCSEASNESPDVCKRLFGMQLMSGSSSAQDAIKSEDLPVETRRTRPVRQQRQAAKEKLHASMSALEGFSPEDLLQEVNRRRTERAQHRQQLAQSLPSKPSAPLRKSGVRHHLSASMPALPSGELSRVLEDESKEQVILEEQPRKGVIQTRDTSDYLWQAGVDCCGALEVACQLEWNSKAPLKARYVVEYKTFFDTSCLKLWKEMKLEKEFRNACASVPPYTTCCGLVQDDDQTIQETAMALNKGWIKDVNQRLKAKKVPFKLDIFVWSWHNATGKAKTSILLIRFLMARR